MKSSLHRFKPSIPISFGNSLGGYWSSKANALFDRQAALDESATLDEQIIYNKAIKALIVSGIWGITDCLQVYKSHAAESALLNWVGDYRNAILGKAGDDYPTFTKNVGFETNGSDNWINTKMVTNAGTKFTLNDSGWMYRTASEMTGDGVSLGNGVSSSSYIRLERNIADVGAQIAINSAIDSIPSPYIAKHIDLKTGLFGVSRISSTQYTAYHDEETPVTANENAVGLLATEVYIGRDNRAAPNELYNVEKAELFWAGGKFTAQQFADFKDIMNTFFKEMYQLNSVDVDDLGAVSDGVTDNFAVIQGALNDVANGTIIIGESQSDIYLVSQPIYIPSWKKLIVNGTLKLKDATIANLTADVDIDTTTVTVDSVVGFAEGEWIAISNDAMPAVGGVSTQTRKVASTGKIVSIVGNDITLDVGVYYAVTATDNAKVGHYQNVITVWNSKHIEISGTGLIDGNLANQYDVGGVANGQWEETGTGIMIAGYVEDISVSGLEVKNNILHGLAFYGNIVPIPYGVSLYDLNVHHNHDKNIVGYRFRDVSISDVEASDAMFEDGITLYTSLADITVTNVVTNRNPRGGLTWGASCVGLALNGLYAEDCSAYGGGSGGLYIMGSGVVAQDISLKRCNLFFENTTHLADYCKDNILSDVIVDGNEFDTTNDAAVDFLGHCTNIVINNLLVENCAGTAFKSTESGIQDAPEGLEINGGSLVDHTGTKEDYMVGTDITFTDFIGL